MTQNIVVKKPRGDRSAGQKINCAFMRKVKDRAHDGGFLAAVLVFTMLLPVAHGLARVHDNAGFVNQAQIEATRQAVMNRNKKLQEQKVNKFDDYKMRMAILSRHNFPVMPRTNPLPRAKPNTLKTMRKQVLNSIAAETAIREGVPVRLFLALVHAESSFNPRARSPVGAIGLTQLMPATANELGVNPYDPIQNLTGGARYLRQQYERFGSWQMALAAYNAGPTRVARLGRIPNIRETKNYIRKIITMASL